jgi:hypothetical protein
MNVALIIKPTAWASATTTGPAPLMSAAGAGAAGPH